MEWDADEGAQVGTYVLHYSDGETRELPILAGRDIRGWWGYPAVRGNLQDARVAWVGSSPTAVREGSYLLLFKSTRDNPRPDVEVTSIDFVSSMAFGSPMLVALTVE